MKGVLTASHYFEESTFKLEQEKIFNDLWIFACLKSAINADQAFATRNVGGLSLLIQNCGGEVRAFENSCAHRLMPIQGVPFGQGKMVCPYHGWVFDDSGLVKTIPKEQTLYQFCEAQRANLKLRQFSVQIIGQFIFVNLAERPRPINLQFSSEMIERLTDISSYFGDISIYSEIPVTYNWKLNFENVLDHQHVPYVHPHTFQPLVKKKSEINNPDVIHPKSDDRLIAQSWFSTTEMKIHPWPWHSLVSAFGSSDTYHNHFIFPNINFISVGGLIFLIQQFDPISASKTIVRFTLCAAKSTKRMPALPAILRGHLKGEVEVLMEDVKYLEKLQSTLHGGLPKFNHGAYEHRLLGFGNCYLALLNGDSTA